MIRKLGELSGEGYKCEVWEDPQTGRVYFTADADIDADGANGQHGALPAYMTWNKGTEHLANGGMSWNRQTGKVHVAEAWAKHIVIMGDDGQPRQFPDGIIASKTAYHFPGVSLDNPKAYVDSETVPYICVPPLIIQKTEGAVLGCRGVVRNREKNLSICCVVADIGPRHKIGEISIAAARAIGLVPSPRTGGTSKPIVEYELWPGQPATINGHTYKLQTSKGTHI